MQLAEPPDRQRVEAARYALLRRLALAMRHQMVVHLQPMGMIGGLLERRLQAAKPDPALVHESLDKIRQLSHQAVDACLDVVGWLAPEGQAQVPLHEGVQECVSLLRSSFAFRGFTLRDEVEAGTTVVSQSGLRTVLPAVLFALTDRAPSPAELLITAAAGPPAALTLELKPRAGEPGFPGNHPYRHLQWTEVEALAQAEGLRLERSGDVVRIGLG